MLDSCNFRDILNSSMMTFEWSKTCWIKVKQPNMRVNVFWEYSSELRQYLWSRLDAFSVRAKLWFLFKIDLLSKIEKLWARSIFCIVFQCLKLLQNWISDWWHVTVSHILTHAHNHAKLRLLSVRFNSLLSVVHKTMSVKITVLGDLTVCILVHRHGRFGGTYSSRCWRWREHGLVKLYCSLPLHLRTTQSLRNKMPDTLPLIVIRVST